MGTNVRPLGSSSITPASPTCTSLPSSIAAPDAAQPPPKRSATDTTLPAHSPISDPMFVLPEVRLIPLATPTCVFARVVPVCSSGSLLPEFLGEPDENSFGAPDVAESVRVLVLDHFADELRAAFAEPGERIVDVLHGEHDA